MITKEFNITFSTSNCNIESVKLGINKIIFHNIIEAQKLILDKDYIDYIAIFSSSYINIIQYDEKKDKSNKKEINYNDYDYFRFGLQLIKVFKNTATLVVYGKNSPEYFEVEL